MTHQDAHNRGKVSTARQSGQSILLEIALVLLPLYVGLLIANRSGARNTTLAEHLTVLGRPITYLGLVATMAILGIVTRRRSACFSDYGAGCPSSWPKTILASLAVSLAVFGAVVLVIDPLLALLPNLAPRDMTRFAFMEGNLPSLLVNLPMMWVTAGFIEELLWRGYLMQRLGDLGWRSERLGWTIALLLSALIFGLAHAYQGTAGMLKTGLIGLVFGIAYLAAGRNLWPLILAHALIDTLDFVGHYMGQ